MRVLFINTVCGYGSTGRICTDIADLLLEQGDECAVAYGRGNVPERYQKIAHKVGEDIHVKMHAGIARLTDSVGFHSTRQTKQLIKWIDEWKPDVIHIHNLHGYYINISVLFEYIKGHDIPVVWTLHDCWPFTGHCVYSDYIGCERWKTGCFECPKKHDYPESILMDRSSFNYQKKRELFTQINNLTIVTVSDWLRTQVEQSFMNAYPIQRIYNGIDRSVFHPVESKIMRKLNIEGKKMLLGVSDLWSERKGLSFFLRYSEEKRDDEAIVMVGFRKEEISNYDQKIIAIERTDSVETLVELYSAADIVLNPSYEDTFGLVTAEALCCGTPVIVQNTTACPELVNDTCGKVIEKNDYEGFKKAIMQLRDSPISTEACLQQAILFDKKHNYQQYIDLYRSVVK